jgi:uncharacterized membrane protein YeiB
MSLYLLPFVLMGAISTAQYFTPVTPPAALAAGAPRPAHKTEAQRSAERVQEEAQDQAKFDAEIRTETHAITQGTYHEFLLLRVHQFVHNLPQEGGFSIVLIGMFLLGAWFVRSGIMTDPASHLDLFRKLACYALPLGLAMGLASNLIGTSGMPGRTGDPYLMAISLMQIGNLPACLGYVGLLVLALHSGTGLARVRVLAPAGRMALTNYLTQSLICSTYFFAYGLGHWGMGRGPQVVFVGGVFSLQVLFSTWWLRHFCYGPMEWLWRAVTYWQWPRMRVTPEPVR